jgi:hypothetical protein
MVTARPVSKQKLMLPLEPRAYLASRQLQCSPGAIEGWKAHVWDVTEGLVCSKFRPMLHTEHTHESMLKVYQESDGIYLRGAFWYLITHQKKKDIFRRCLCRAVYARNLDQVSTQQRRRT